MAVWDFIEDAVDGFLGGGGDDDRKGEIKLTAKEQQKLKQTPEAAKTVIGEEATTALKTAETTSEAETKNMFNEAATAAVTDLSKLLAGFAQTDQNFYENIFQPYQESLITTNQDMLPMLKGLSEASINASLRALQGNDLLRAGFESQARGATAAGTDVAARFRETFDNMPTTQERVSAARVGVEAEFGRARQAIERELQSKAQTLGVGQGRTLSRNLAIEKAKAKAAATDTAAEAARREQADMLSAGIGVFGEQGARATSADLGIQAQTAALNTGLQAGIQGSQGGVAAAGQAAGAIAPIATRAEGQVSTGVTAGTTEQTGAQSSTALVNPLGTKPGMLPGQEASSIPVPGGGVGDPRLSDSTSRDQLKSDIVGGFLDMFEGTGLADGGIDGFNPGGEFGAYKTSGSGLQDFLDYAPAIGKEALKGIATGGVGTALGWAKGAYDQATGQGFTDPNDDGEGTGVSGGFSEGNEAVGEYGGWGDLI